MAGAKQSFWLMRANRDINTEGITQLSVEPIPPDVGAAFVSATQNIRPDRETVQSSTNT